VPISSWIVLRAGALPTFPIFSATAMVEVI
jgi:hypothetical protein